MQQTSLEFTDKHTALYLHWVEKKFKFGWWILKTCMCSSSK